MAVYHDVCVDHDDEEGKLRVKHRLTLWGRKFIRLLRELEKLQTELDNGSLGQ